jgi:hypothetical protein
MGKRRGKATQSASTPGNGGATSDLSGVRGDNLSSHVTDFPGSSGLSGMPATDPNRKASEIPAGAQAVAGEPGPRVRALESLSLEERVDMLNALRKIRRKYPTSRAASDINVTIASLYCEWVDSLISQVLGGTAFATGFTKEEFNALKVMAKTILQRQSQASAPSTSQPQRPQPTPPAQSPAAPRSTPAPVGNKATPLKESVDVDAFQSAQRRLLDQLSKMDREAPEF